MAKAKTAKWRNRICGQGEEAPGNLLPNPRNWRLHPTAQRDAMKGVLAEVGWVQDVIVNRRTGHLVDGHLRVALASERGEAAVPVKYVELTKAEEALVLTTLDPIAGMAEAGKEALEALLADAVTGDEAVAALLASVAQKAGIRNGKAGLTDDDAVPEVPAEPISKLGDLWLLGDHRLLCGDATKAEDVERLLDGAVPVLCVTDPPYGVEYDPAWRNVDRAHYLSIVRTRSAHATQSAMV